MHDADRKLFIPVYGHSMQGKLAVGFDELTLPDGVFVPVGRGTLHAAYVPRAAADLLGAYQRTNQDPGSPEACALLAEIERRGLSGAPARSTDVTED